MNDECLVTANTTDVDNSQAVSDVFCDNTDCNGVHGILVYVLLPDPMPPIGCSW